jgi:hypothetical protein
MVATNAFGLGVDKANVRNVLHYHVPGSVEAYAQEAGRGGRDGKPARCVLLFSPDDVAIQEFFLKGTYPTRRQVRAVYKALEAWEDHAEGEPPTLPNLALGARVGVPRTRTVLSLLKDEGFVIERDGGVFALTEPPPDERELNEKAKQYEARRIADRQRLDALLDYVRTPGCRSQVILRYLGEKDPPVCGRCDNDLRSKEAALAAAREATMLEDGVIQRLREEDQEDEDQASRQRRQVRARLIRIDGSVPAAASAAAAAAAEASAAAAAATRPAAEPAGELARLVAEQAADQEGAPQVVVPAPGPAAYEDEDDDDELEGEEAEGDDDELEAEGDDDEYEDDDDEYEDDDEDDEDDEDLAIDKTAAALAEEGADPEDSEITVLARKRVPKPPRKKKQELEAVDAGDGKRKRRRRRRKRRAALPPKSAFTTPVLVRPAGTPTPTSSGGSSPAPPPPSGRGSSSGPLVEYVRGPMRINMTPVASATPNDVAPGARGKNRRRSRGPGGRPTGPVRSIVASGGQPVGGGYGQGPRPGGPVPPGIAQQRPDGAPGGDGGGKKRRRRRRRKRRGGDGQNPGQFDPTAPVHFFSVEGQPSGGGGGGAPGGNGAPGPNGQKKRRRRRRRRGRGNRPDLPPGTERPQGADSSGQSQSGSPEHAAPAAPVARPPDGTSRDSE